MGPQAAEGAESVSPPRHRHSVRPRGLRRVPGVSLSGPRGRCSRGGGMAEMLVLVGDVEPGDQVAVAGAWLPVRAVQPHHRDGGHRWERAVRLVFGSWVRLTYGAEETLVVRRPSGPLTR